MRRSGEEISRAESAYIRKQDIWNITWQNTAWVNIIIWKYFISSYNQSRCTHRSAVYMQANVTVWWLQVVAEGRWTCERFDYRHKFLFFLLVVMVTRHLDMTDFFFLPVWWLFWVIFLLIGLLSTSKWCWSKPAKYTVLHFWSFCSLSVMNHMNQTSH